MCAITQPDTADRKDRLFINAKFLTTYIENLMSYSSYLKFALHLFLLNIFSFTGYSQQEEGSSVLQPALSTSTELSGKKDLVSESEFSETVKAVNLDSGNTAWMITATALVLFMTLPGLALFYGGLVQSKNVLSVLMHCFTIACVASIF